MAYLTIVVETRDHVGLITLNRPEARNALNAQVMGELSEALVRFDEDETIRCIVITGDDKAFAAGADIKEMQAKTFVDAYKQNFITTDWERASQLRTPTIAAVAGYALGGGCELAMMCDIVIAADTARFGQPEINLGTMPGIGGTQRLTRLVGKAKAMDMCLTGRFMDAEEAERSGLVSRVFPADDLIEETMKIAAKIAEKSAVAAMATKEAIDRAYETTLAEGVGFERRLFHALFSTDDQKEGMSAFVEKRQPQFRHR